MNGRTGQLAVPAILAFLDPLRPGDADGPDANDPERVDRGPPLERALDVRGQVEHERKGVQSEPEEEREHRTTRLPLRHPPDRGERRRGRGHVQDRIEDRDGCRLRVAADVGRERGPEVERDGGNEREHDGADVEDERVQDEPLPVTTEEYH